MTMASTAQRATHPRWIILTILLSIAALILSACGARIETQLGLEGAEKGTRTMLVSFNLKDNQEKIKGGTQALDASVRKHLPDGLDYEGIQTEGKKARATFKVSFSSVAEYRSKVTALLNASGSNIKPQISIVNSEQGLVKGFQVKENFTSSDLLGWVPEALVMDGVVPASNKNSVFSSDGDTTVKLGDKEVKNSGGSKISAKDVQDRGFRDVFIEAAEKGDGYSVVVSFVAKEIMSSETSSTIDAYLNQVKPEGSELKKGLETTQAKTSAPPASTGAAKEETGRTLTFTASSGQDLSDKLKKLFGAGTTDLSFSREVTEDNGSFNVVKSVSGTLDCSLLCSPDGYGVSMILKDSSDKSYRSDSSSSSSESSNKIMPSFTLVSSRHIEMKSVKIAISLGLDGSMEARFLYSFPTEDISGAEQKLKDVFAGGGDNETEVHQDGDATVVSVKVHGKDEGEFNRRLDSYLPGSKITLTRPGGYHPFGTEYTVNPSNKLSSKLGTYYSAPFELTFKAPPLSSLDQQKVDAANSTARSAQVQLTVSGGELSVKTARGVNNTSGLTIPASGMSLTDVIVDAVILALILLILLVLFLFRKKIAAARQQSRERRAATAAAYTVTAVPTAGAAGATHGMDPQSGPYPQGGYQHSQAYPAQPAQPPYPAQGGYRPQQSDPYATDDDSPTRVFTPQQGAYGYRAQDNYAQEDSDPTVVIPAQSHPVQGNPNPRNPNLQPPQSDGDILQ